MATNAQVKRFTFTVSFRVDGIWTAAVTYSTKKVSLPAALQAYNTWSDKHLMDSLHYRIDGEADGKNVYQHSNIPEPEPEPETMEERELRLRKMIDPKAYQ